MNSCQGNVSINADSLAAHLVTRKNT